MRPAPILALSALLVASVVSAPASAAIGRLATIISQDSATLPMTRVEYYCSPGFEPGRGGTCVAVPSRAEVELFVDQPITGPYHRYRRHHYRRRALRERY